MESTVSFKRVLPAACISSCFKSSNSYLQKFVGEKKRIIVIIKPRYFANKSVAKDI